MIKFNSNHQYLAICDNIYIPFLDLVVLDFTWTQREGFLCDKVILERPMLDTLYTVQYCKAQTGQNPTTFCNCCVDRFLCDFVT